MSAPKFQRAGYERVQLYSPADLQCTVDLSDNTNLWGPAPSAVDAIRKVDQRISRYPSSYSRSLAEAFSSYLGVAPEYIVTGCGSDDILDSAIRAFAEPGDVVAMCDPTFSMLSVFTTLNGAVPVKIPFLESRIIDAEALLSSGARIIYLCSPNNPTGSVIPAAQIEDILARFDGIVILDEAYAEFVGESFASVAPARDNLIVTRTMSKAFGLAGIRVGCSISNPSLAAEISKSRGPYKVSQSSEAAAIAALENDVDWMRSCVIEANANRETLAQRLDTIGFPAIPSRANFLLVPVADAVAVGDKFAARGIAVRAFRGLQGIGDAIRVTVGPSEVMTTFLAAFPECVA